MFQLMLDMYPLTVLKMSNSKRLEILKAWMYENANTKNLGDGLWTSRRECLYQFKKSITTK